MVAGERQRRSTRWRVERRLIVVAAILALFYGGGLVGAALLPLLIRDDPLLLLLLQPTSAVLLLVSARIDFAPLVAITVLRRFANHLLFFLLGAWYHARAVRWVEARSGGAGSVVRAVERFFARVGPAVVLLFPGPVPSVLAGAGRMRWRVFVALDLIGTLVWVLIVRFVALVASGPVEDVVRYIERNAVWLTAVFGAATALWLLVERARGRGVIATVGGLEQSLAGGTDLGADARDRD